MRSPNAHEDAGEGEPEAHLDLNDPAALSSWVGRLVVDEAARSRARGYWLRRQAEEEGSFVGVLADLSERSRTVMLHLTNGRLHRGRISMIATDFVVVAVGDREVIVRLSSIASIQTMPRDSLTSGDRVVAGELTMAEAVAALADERARVILVGNQAATAVRGELRSVGRDVATVRLDGSGGTAYVALASVDEVSLAESG